MSHPDRVNLRQVISSATNHVFATMLGMKVRDALFPSAASPDEERVVASVGFAGHGIAGGLTIKVTTEFAAAITAAMLGSGPKETQNPADVNDVMSELANVLGGNCLAALGNLGYPCALSLPTVTSGMGLQINTIRGAKHECLAFEQGSNQFFISLDLKIRQ